MSDPAAGLVSPAIVSTTGVLGGIAHEAPASVIVIVVLLPGLVAVQLFAPAVNAIVGLAGTVKPELTATVIVEPETSVPEELVVKPTVQVERAVPVCGEPVKETLETDGSIVYGNGSFVSSRRSSRRHPDGVCRSAQCEPAGVMSWLEVLKT